MSVSSQRLQCHACNEDFGISLEWETKDSAIKRIQETKCPKCGGDIWSFTDSFQN